MKLTKALKALHGELRTRSGAGRRIKGFASAGLDHEIGGGRCKTRGEKKQQGEMKRERLDETEGEKELPVIGDLLRVSWSRKKKSRLPRQGSGCKTT